MLLRTQHGNILWDCIANLDDATRGLIEAMGGIHAIAISHPHYYTTMQDWAAAFAAPIFLHENDRQWVLRASPAIRFWSGDTLQILPTATLVRLGGHFAGGSVLFSQDGKGTILAGDIVQVTPGADRVSFMWSYPNMLPLSANTVRRIVTRISNFAFSELYGAFEGQDIHDDAREIVIASGDTYIRRLRSDEH